MQCGLTSTFTFDDWLLKKEDRPMTVGHGLGAYKTVLKYADAQKREKITWNAQVKIELKVAGHTSIERAKVSIEECNHPIHW